jgi:hypothetical protein
MDVPGATLELGPRHPPSSFVDEAAHRRIDQVLHQALQPRAVDGRDRLGLADSRAEQPEHHRHVPNLIEDGRDPIGVGHHRFQAGGQDALGIARIARRSASLPPRADQAPAQLLAAASAANDQGPRQIPLRRWIDAAAAAT